MSGTPLVRGLSGIFLAWLWLGTACSSSDEPTTPEGDGGASAGAPANAGKAGKGGAGSGTGGQASGGTAGHAAGMAGHAAAGTSGHAGSNVGGAGTAGHPEAGASTGGAGMAGAAGPEAGSGGDSAVGCQASDDHCPAGQYCSSAGSCLAGCKNGDSCASGVCGIDHDCQNCISDQECAEPHVCSAGQCAAACGVAERGTNQGCGAGLTCCTLHCVATANDQQHCGACGTPCADNQFCGQLACVASQFASLCRVGKAAVVLDGQYGDDPTGRALGQALVAHCPTNLTVREVSQTVADVLNPSTGRPVSGSDELLVIAGGNYYQKAVGYLVTNKLSPLSNSNTQTTIEIRDSRTDALIASELIADVSDSHDLFALQFTREPSSGSLILNAYGFTVGGTAAATLYFEKVLAPDLASATKAWYVGEWTDKNADQKPDLDELTSLASGG
ncbi:MAG TPA: hypothetical protein VGC79_32285 [Polyangiaceae bacterium]